MRFIVKHEIKGRLRIHLDRRELTLREADMFCCAMSLIPGVKEVKVYERTADAAILYEGGLRPVIIEEIRRFSFQDESLCELVPKDSGRALNREFEEKLVAKVVCKAACTLFLPPPLRLARILWHMVPFVRRGLGCLLRRRVKVELLDALSISISAFRGDFDTAGTVMFLLEVGELLEEWTRKKSVADLARCMSLNVDRVWLRTAQGEVLVPVSQIQPGDAVVVRAGGIVPVDGLVLEGEVTVNQASLTGESIPVPKRPGGAVYAGTVVEEGECVLEVKQASGQSRYDQIVHMIEQSEQMKSEAESKAANLADKLVPYTFVGSLLSFVLTRNVARALSVLMVDFSCALKLAMPLAVLSAMREAGRAHITVKGGKFLEAVAQADTIVFDKTGTLTKAQPTVKQVVAFNGMSENELLRIAACLEEHFPHSMAKAVVQAAIDRHLVHEELHSKVEYIVAHGISSKINDKKVVIGSYHFVFEDEKCAVPDGMMEAFDKLPSECSHLFMAIDHELAAVICIEDPLREEAAAVVRKLKETGISKVVMMTGDSDRTAKAIAARVGVDEYYSEVLPEDKASFVEEEKKAGRKVIMIGDGINDSPALSAADIGIAISDGAEIAREIADITVGADSLNELVTLKLISDGLMKRIHKNYRFIVGFNTGLIVLGVAGILQPATSALLHNTSTLMIGLKSMQDIL